MGDGGRGVDLELVSRMVASHLRDRGVDASARGREIRVAPGLKLRLRPDPPDPDDVTSMFWIDVDGLHLEPPMRLDVSAWGLSADAQVMDAVHGILDSILPPVRWLAAEPWLPASDEAGHVLELEGAARREWTLVAGDPWIVVALMDADGDPDALVPPLRAAIAGSRSPRSTHSHPCSIACWTCRAVTGSRSTPDAMAMSSTVASISTTT